MFEFIFPLKKGSDLMSYVVGSLSVLPGGDILTDILSSDDGAITICQLMAQQPCVSLHPMTAICHK